MKATEIQIGDIILVEDTTRKVVQVTKHKIGYHLCENECRMHYARLEDVKPIELTREILEKNGFVKFEFGWKHTEEDITFYVDKEGMSLSLYGEGVGVTNDDIKFVHHYQHLLRLCRLTELADNFKI